MNYVIGSLFPRKQDGTPNIKYSSSLIKKTSNDSITIEAKDDNKSNNTLKANINITSKPVLI